MIPSMIAFWQALVLVGIVAMAILGGVLIGAYAVFRTKREGHESFVGAPPKGEVFSIDDWGEQFETEEEPEKPEAVMQRNNDFVDQLAGRMGP